MITIRTNDVALQERLLREPDIDLDKSIKLGKAAEVTRQQAKILQAHGEEKSMSAITKTLKDKPPSNYSKEQGTSKIIQCKFCSYTYSRWNCPAYNKTCNTCGRRGHFSTCCKENRVRAIHRHMPQDPPHQTWRLKKKITLLGQSTKLMKSSQPLIPRFVRLTL